MTMNQVNGKTPPMMKTTTPNPRNQVKSWKVEPWMYS